MILQLIVYHIGIDDESTFFGNDTINGTITYNYVETCEAIGTGSDICTIESLGGQWRSMTIVSFLCGCFAFAFLTIHGITHIHKVHAYCCSCGVCNVLDQCCSCFLTSSVYFGLAFGGVMAGFGVFVWQFKNPVYKASSEIDYQPGVSIYLAGAAGALLLIACCLALPQRSTDESKVTDDKVGYSSQPSTGSYIETTNKV